MEREPRLGFTKVTRNGRDGAQCLHCSVVMSNASLRPSKLKTQLDKKHLQRKDDDINALFDKRVRYDLEAMLPHLRFTVEEKLTFQCSYDVAYQNMVEIIIRSGAKKKI